MPTRFWRITLDLSRSPSFVRLLLIITRKAASYVLFPMAVASHPQSHYVAYLNDYRPNSTSSDRGSVYYVNEFESVEGFEAPPDIARSASMAFSFLRR